MRERRLAVVEGGSIRASAYDLADLWQALDCDPDEIIREMIYGTVLLSPELGRRPWSVRKIHAAVDKSFTRLHQARENLHGLPAKSI
jgi:hypothetical protein